MKKVYCKLLFVFILCLTCFPVTVKAAEPENYEYSEDENNIIEDENEVAEDATSTSKEKIDVSKSVEIHIELEDEKTNAGVSLYRIGVYSEKNFSYLPEYEGLLSRKYEEIKTEKERQKHIKTISDYILENGVKEDGRVVVIKGHGVSAELPVGLYLVIQNDDSTNVSFEEVLCVEAPTFSETNFEYMYEMHVYPKWEKVVWFSFRPEVVHPLMLVMALIICLLLCFNGARIFNVLFVMASALSVGLAGFEIGMKYTESYLFSMVTFVYATYLMVVILHFLFKFLKIKIIKKALPSMAMVCITPIVGGIGAYLLIYNFLSKNNLICILIPVIVAVVGLVCQIASKKRAKIFYTYDDLIGEQEEKTKNSGRIWVWLNVLMFSLYLCWRVFFTIPIGYGVVSNVAGIMLLIVEGLGLVESIVHYSNMNNAKEYKKPSVPNELFPDVDVFIATYSEPTKILEKTILGCKRMDYPDKNKVHIYLCDDGHREEMKELANKLGINYLDREDHVGQKAGNLNNALKHSSSPYVVTFDSDMIPQSNFLMETIPYFVDAELKNKNRDEKDQIKLGFLQTPQSFYDLDLFQFNLHSETKIPNEQDYFYRDIEVARTKSNSCIYGGSNTVLSREALDAVGGFYMEAITEDFATGILIQKAGFVSLAISKRLASGVSAQNLKDLIQQRVRWGRGVISTGRKVKIYTSKDLSFEQKVNYWASIWYWYAPVKRFLYVMSPILYATFGFMVFRCRFWEVLLFWLPMYFISDISLKKLSNNIRSTKWTAIYEYTLFPYMLVPILLETIGISLKTFKVTSKSVNEEENEGSIAFKIPIIIIIVMTVIGVVRGIYIIFESNSLGPVVVLFWLIYNLFSMVMCLFFVDGRKRYRNAERVYAKEKATLCVNNKLYSCETRDMSESGLAVYLEKPILVKSGPDSGVYIEVETQRWKSKLWVDIKHTNQEKDSWLYTFKIEKFDSYDSYDQYLAILYDRVTTNPSFIKSNNGVYDDLSTNIGKRFTVASYFRRQNPRIKVDGYIDVKVNGETTKVKVNDFNYQYFASECCGKEVVNGKTEVAKNVVFIVGNNEIEAEFEKKLERSYLYKVLNYEHLYFEVDCRDEVMEGILAVVNES